MNRALYLMPLLFSISLYGQNWAPINSHEQFNYSNPGLDILSYTWIVDSVSYSVDDSTYYFNKVVKDCWSCNESSFGLMSNSCTWSEPCIVELNSPQSYGDSCVISIDGIWNFFGEYPFELRPTASAGESWVFQGALTATVDWVVEGLVLGVTDSLKYIAIDGGEYIVLSKNHGAVEINTAAPEWAVLRGIQERSVGIPYPDFEQVFDYDLGDVFEYRFEEDFILSRSGTFKHEVISVEETPDSIMVDFDRVHQENWVAPDMSTGWTAYHDTLTITYRREDWNHLEAGLHELSTWTVPNRQYGNSTNQWSYESDIDYEEGRVIREFGMHLDLVTTEPPHTGQSGSFGAILFPFYDTTGYMFASPTPYDFFLFPESVDFEEGNMSFSCGEGLGRTSYYEFAKFDTNCEWMVGYVKDGDTTGVVTPNDILLSTNEVQANVEVQVFPNPFVGALQIQLHAGPNELKVVDLSGRTVFSEELHSSGGIHSIDLTALKPGIYILNLLGEEGSASSRIIKERASR